MTCLKSPYLHPLQTTFHLLAPSLSTTQIGMGCTRFWEGFKKMLLDFNTTYTIGVAEDMVREDGIDA